MNKYFSLYASLENQKGPVRVDKAYRSLSSNKIVFTGEVNKSAALLLEKTDLSNSAVKVNMSLLQCPPGYTYYNDTIKCHCSSEQQSSTSKHFHYTSPYYSVRQQVIILHLLTQVNGLVTCILKERCSLPLLVAHLVSVVILYPNVKMGNIICH